MKTCGNRNYRKWLALMVSGGLAVTALAGCGGSDGGTEQSAQTEVSEGIKTAAEDNKVTTFALPDGPEESEIYVEPIADLPDDFILGMDASAVLSLENSGVTYYNYEGKEQDVFETLAQSGVNYIRLRVWNDPYDADGNGYGGGNNDVATAVTLGKRATAYGMKVCVDFHYSDFWADPKRQHAPKAWEGMSASEKSEALYDFTKESLAELLDAGVEVGMVQVGNEINGGMAGEWSTNGRNQLMNAGSAAVRATLPDALVAVHFTNVSQSDAKKYIREVCEGDTPVDFDVMAYSYYSYWHGSLENLSELMADVRETFGKDVFIAETAYPFTTNNLDTHPNSVPNEWCDMKQDISRDGQAADFRETVETAVQAGALGVCYWEPAWIPVPGNSWEEQSKLWEQFGSGWASSYAGGYDPQDAGAWFGGCAWENQALFEVDGTLAWTLSLPNILRGE